MVQVLVAAIIVQGSSPPTGSREQRARASGQGQRELRLIPRPSTSRTIDAKPRGAPRAERARLFTGQHERGLLREA